MISTLLLIIALQSNADRIETLTRIDDRACTGDQAWCVGLVEGVQEGEPVVRPVLRHPDALPSGRTTKSEVEHFQPWTGLVRLADGGFLAGVQVETSSMYSGGGGQATELRLYRLDAGGDAGTTPVLTVPIRSELMIRACFSEEDMAQRAGACHDEYAFDAVLTATGEAGVMPVFTYGTTATAYPRGVSRSEDSLEKPPLKPADLVKTRDPKCSFTRRFTFDAASGAYRPDRKLPDCSDYTTP
ncbi:MAG: hypothetical protein P0Y50_01480 [Candidatus Brevundimonas colombiensis]|uniref:Uncharacterized protein n=1 Tax=Candidatus Brevundimonas colombiensis TaxID=3121376 RepID=A0AAJ5X1I4_9CAUL|nr:hypothetical protein [Brevundimonas sp.]WEK40304.1 MAG: hypothetical protein P0Y50_01480 [Brevundimonas sp.]